MADGQIGESTDLFKLFVGQIPKEMDEISLRQYFEEFGPIVEVSIIRDNITMLSKGCAFVTYSYEHSAQMAMDKLHDKVQLPNSMNALQVRFAETQVDRDNKLFIGMLPKTLGEQDLHDLFSMYGELREVHVIRGPEGGAKGCAFVKFVEREAAVAAIENLNDTIPAGATRPLVVKFADGKKPAGKEDPWQGQQIPQTYRPMGSSMHMGGQHLQQPASQQQQRMMYQYPTMGQVVGVPGMQLSSPYGQQGQASPVMLQAGQPQQQQRYMYMQQSPPGPQGQPGSYYSPPNSAGGHQQQLPPSIQGSGSGELPADPVSPMYGSQHSPQDLLVSKPVPQEGEYGRSNSPPPGQGLEVLPPAQSQQQQQFPLDSESSHVRPPEGPSGANLFIYHLPRDLTDADLATLFAPFGNVISAKVFVDKKTSDSKGFGFVSYDTLENANSAIESMNGFQIGSKRLKVQHKRVLGSNPPGQHSPYGPPHMQQQQHHHHIGGQQQHGQHSLYQSPQQQQQQQQLQNPSYYRPSPGLGGGAGGMIGAPMLGQPNPQQQHLQYGAMGLQSQQQPQQMGLGQYGMRAAPLGAGGRMQQQPGGPMGGGGAGAGGGGGGGGGGARGVGGGGYGYSYPTLGAYPVPGASMQQPPQQQLRPAPGMQSARVDMYGSPAGMQQPQQQQGSTGGMAYPSNDQHAALAGAQSTHGAISYMDANSGGKPQQQSSNVSGFYGQY